MNLSREVKSQAYSICLLHIPEGVEISSFSAYYSQIPFHLSQVSFVLKWENPHLFAPVVSNFIWIYFTLIIPLQSVLPKARAYQHHKSSVLQGLQLSNNLVWQANHIKLQLYPFNWIPQLQIINITEGKVLSLSSPWAVRVSPGSFS